MIYLTNVLYFHIFSFPDKISRVEANKKILFRKVQVELSSVLLAIYIVSIPPTCGYGHDIYVPIAAVRWNGHLFLIKIPTDVTGLE